MADRTSAKAPGAIGTEGVSPQRLKLQTNYGQALMWSKGYAAEETRVALERTQGLLSAGSGNAAERWVSIYGQWVGKAVRGETEAARSLAEAMRREAEEAGLAMEARAASRILGLSCTFMGDFREARDLLARIIRVHNSAHDQESRFRFTMDTRIGAMTYLALPTWHLGDAAEATKLVREAYL